MADWTGAAGSIGAALIGGIFNNRAVSKQNAMNLQIARETNEAQLNALRENNAFNKQAAIDMFNLESNYNSPYNQVQRLKEAGLNPAVMMEGNISSTAGNTNASTPSAAATPTLYAPTMQAEPSVFSGLFQNMESITRMIDNVSKARLSDAQKFDIMSKVQPMIDVMKSEEEKNRALTAFQNVQTTLANISNHFAVRKNALELADMVSSIALKTSQGNLADAQKELAEFEANLTDSKNKLLIQQTPYLINEVKEGVELIKQQQKTEQTKQAENVASAAERRASATEHYAGAGEKQERAETERQIREHVVEQAMQMARKLHVETDILANEKHVSDATITQTINNIIWNSEKTFHEKEILRQRYAKAVMENNWYEVEEVLKVLGAGVDAGTKAYGATRPPMKPTGKTTHTYKWGNQSYRDERYIYE